MFAIGLVLFCVGMLLGRTFGDDLGECLIVVVMLAVLCGGFLMLGSAALFFWRVMP